VNGAFKEPARPGRYLADRARGRERSKEVEVGLETGVWFVHTTDGTAVECNNCGWVREIAASVPLERFADDRLAQCEQCGAAMTHLLGEISELPFQ
jgi:hypothetical protein